MTPTEQNSALTDLRERLVEWEPTPADVAVIVGNLAGEMEAEPQCRECGCYSRDLEEDDACGDCAEKAWRAEAAAMEPLYDAEKRAGLLRPQHEIDQELREAGRGHLVRQ